MSIKDKFHEQSTIKITVLKIDGKKLTKSIFDQIGTAKIFDKDYSIAIDKIFGFVKNPIKFGDKYLSFWIIGEDKGKLIKYNYDHLLRFSKLNLDSVINTDKDSLDYYVDNPKYLVKDKYITSYGFHDNNLIKQGETFRELIKEEKIVEFENKLINVKEFVTELVEHQIYF